MKLMQQKGQIVLILLLVMSVALGIGVSVIQRSLSDISTSSKVEQSSRAFSAAEAGIERALRGDPSGANFAEIGSSAAVNVSDLLPPPGVALGYPPIAKEEVAQVWLSDLDSSPPTYYGGASFTVYFGDVNVVSSDKPAIEVSLVTLSGGSYLSKKYFLDADSGRTAQNGFQFPSCGNFSLTVNNNVEAKFLCQVTISGYTGSPILVRLRILYSNSSQPVAVAPAPGSSLPAQAKIITSTGKAGETQRKIQLFKLDKVVPFYFDYAIFSAGDINK